MLKSAQKKTSVRYTTVLSQDCIDELKNMAEHEIISSVNHGIRLAIESFIEGNKRKEYELAMQEAASDHLFLKRTLETQEAFSSSDADEDAAW
jgi:hypothetical protein